MTGDFDPPVSAVREAVARALEKAAVRAGGGANHRGNLSDAVLIKDNHLRHCGITEAVRRARARWPGAAVEVECDTLDQLVAPGHFLVGGSSPVATRQTRDAARRAATVATAPNPA